MAGVVVRLLSIVWAATLMSNAPPADEQSQSYLDSYADWNMASIKECGGIAAGAEWGAGFQKAQMVSSSERWFLFLCGREEPAPSVPCRYIASAPITEPAAIGSLSPTAIVLFHKKNAPRHSGVRNEHGLSIILHSRDYADLPQAGRGGSVPVSGSVLRFDEKNCAPPPPPVVSVPDR